MSTDTRSPIVTQTLADGTVQHACEYHACTGGRWFTPARSDARYCSGNCRVAHHRYIKAMAQRKQERIERERYLADATRKHRQRWVQFLNEHTPERSSMTEAKCAELYEAMMEHGMIEGPFPQARLF